MRRPWRIVKQRLGLSVDVLSTYSTRERALAALPETRETFLRIGVSSDSIYVLDPAGNRVNEEGSDREAEQA
jgi:hypothetical protein